MNIKDIAKESGYSVGTVSRVMNHAPGVSQAAKDAVMSIVKKNNFKLNNNARHLRQPNPVGIAIIVKGVRNMLFAQIVEQMQGIIEKRGYTTTIYFVGEEDNEVEEALFVSREINPLGILFMGSNQKFYDEEFEMLDAPCLMVSNSAEELGYDNLSSVSTDDVAAVRLAIEHLVKLGHTKIGILGGKLDQSFPARCRYKGCEEAFEVLGIDFDMEKQLEQSFFSIEGGYEAMGRLIAKAPDITAVFAMSDVMAIGAIRFLQDRGIRVPDDVSVMGFDGIEIGRYMVPRLATIRQNKEQMALRSVEILLDSIENHAGAHHEVVRFSLLEGESVKKI